MSFKLFYNPVVNEIIIKSIMLLNSNIHLNSFAILNKTLEATESAK